MKAAIRNTALALTLVAGGSACVDKSEVNPQDARIIQEDLEKSGFNAERFTIDRIELAEERTGLFLLWKNRGFIGKIGVKGCEEKADVSFSIVDGVYTPTTLRFSAHPDMPEDERYILTPQKVIDRYGCRAVWEAIAVEEALEAQEAVEAQQ